jgi:Flp pilus assembly protein TadB
MTLVLLCALAASIGVALLAFAVAPRRPSLAAELDELLGTGQVVGSRPRSFWDSFADEMWTLFDHGDAEGHFPALLKDLAATDSSQALFARQMVTTAALFAALGAGLVAVLAAEGLHVPGGLSLGIVALSVAIGSVVPRATLRGQAMDRRSEMREAVAVICDLAAVLIAAGEDVDGALVAAADAGGGWAFEAVRTSLPVSGRLGAWLALEGLGERLGVEELVVLAQNMGLAEEKGAKVREALNTQAKTLREEAASEVEAKAGSMTERMSFPMVMLLAGFLLVIGYPAVARL